MAPRSELPEAIDRLNENQVGHVMAMVQGLLEKQPDPVLERLKRIPGVELPAHWPPQFEQFEPVQVEGEPISEQLIRERR